MLFALTERKRIEEWNRQNNEERKKIINLILSLNFSFLFFYCLLLFLINWKFLPLNLFFLCLFEASFVTSLI